MYRDDGTFDIEPAVEISNVSKKFCKNLKTTRKYAYKDIITSFFINRAQSIGIRPGEFFALKNISFSLKRGETIGIIGLNGSGKSTLLKMINGLILPDSGEIKINGSVGALIELGTGFHPTLTGRENIYTKGAMLGKSKSELNLLYGEIVSFSELEDFIDSPFKTYSSGMKVRLGFSVAIHMSPDILLLDEVLAVGDYRFKQKCLSKINEVRANVATIFVSHSMNQIKLFCDSVIVLEKGKITFRGNPDDAIRHYLADLNKNGPNRKNHRKPVAPLYGNLFQNEKKIRDVEHYWANEQNQRVGIVETGMCARIIIKFKLCVDPVRLIIGVPIWNLKGEFISAIGSDMSENELSFTSKGEYRFALDFPQMILNPGEYISVVAIHDRTECYYRGLNETINVMSYKRSYGHVEMPHSWRLIQKP